MTRTSVLVRWEACRAGTTGGVLVREEGDGTAISTPSVEHSYVLTERHDAPLGPERSPPDVPQTVYMHDALVSDLAPGTCRSYELAQDSSRRGRFCTSREDGARVHFLSLGDTNPLLGDATKDLLSKVLPRNPDFTVHGGDIQYYDSLFETWAGWFPVMQPLLAQGAMMPALGNHELETADELADYSLRFFGHPSLGGDTTWYRFESGGVWFHVLDTEKPIDGSSAQGAWLLESLKTAAETTGFRTSIIVLHRPFVTCGDSAQNDSVRRSLASVFAQRKVRLVLQSHVHGYERFEIDGVTYVTTAGGGALLYDMDVNLSRVECAMRIASGAFFHAVDVVVDGDVLRGEVIDHTGKMRDAFDVNLH